MRPGGRWCGRLKPQAYGIPVVGQALAINHLGVEMIITDRFRQINMIVLAPGPPRNNPGTMAAEIADHDAFAGGACTGRFQASRETHIHAMFGPSGLHSRRSMIRRRVLLS